jgi:ADP-ribosyl-[dinitrogen reductase] hydrolase
MVKGSCLCGGVEFEIDGKLTPIQLCHARRCQKFTGSAFSPELAAKKSRLRWIRGEDLITEYEAPLLREPPPLRRAFCRVCGSPLPVDLEGTDYVVLLAGVLDDDPGTRPFRHIFVAHDAPWSSITGDLPRFEEGPPEDQRIRPTKSRG